MGAQARQRFLGRFEPHGRGVGFAVLGGVFAEGVNLPGSLLIGAFIATLGLPPVSVTQDQIQARLDKLFGADHGYADRVPAMHKVVQAAGRVLRTPEDRGVALAAGRPLQTGRRGGLVAGLVGPVRAAAIGYRARKRGFVGCSRTAATVAPTCPDNYHPWRRSSDAPFTRFRLHTSFAPQE